MTGDNENIVIDFLKLPPEVGCIMIGVLLVQAQSQLAQASIHISPLLRGEQVESSFGSPEVEEESEDDEEAGSRGIEESQIKDDENELLKIFQDKLEEIPGFPQQRGYVAGRILRTGPQSWSWTPIRQVVQADFQSGIWPALEYYGKPA